jgi:drug/metabolite transporter (DMT)-like permease
MNKNYIYCILAIFLFSTIELMGKILDTSVSPLAITCYRFITGGFFLFLIYLIKGTKQKVELYDFLEMSLVGILNVCVSMYMLQLGIYYGQANLSAIIISSNPIFVGIFALFILKERFNIFNIISWIIGIFGISVVILGQFGVVTDSRNIILGIIFSVLASITFGLYTVLSKSIIQKYDIMLFNSISFIGGAIVLFILGLFSHQVMIFKPDLKNIVSMLYLGIFVTGIAYVFFFMGLKKIKTVSGSVFFLLKPIFATILAVLCLDENLSFIQVIGVIIVIISLFLNTFIEKIFYSKISYLTNFKYVMKAKSSYKRDKIN